MNNIEILEMQLKKIKNFCKDNNNKNYYPEELPYYMFWNGKQAEIVENLIHENKELKEKLNIKNGDVEYLSNKINKHFIDDVTLQKDYIPKSKVKELAKKYEFALNGYDSSTADYKHSQDLGRYLACVELLEEGE